MCDRLKVWTADPLESGSCLPMAALLGRNFVSRFKTREVRFPRHEGALSIKSVVRGREMYEIDGARMAVDSESWLVLNDDQCYASEIDSEEETESFCIWFRSGLAEETVRSLHDPCMQLLDDPFKSGRRSVHFFDKVYARDELVSPLVSRLQKELVTERRNGEWLDEQLHVLMQQLLRSQSLVREEVESLTAVRASTREELYRRLHRARDFMDAHLTMPLSLGDIASAACLSPHHFLRTFKQFFGETPHQYRTRRRMEQARVLLLRTDRPVTAICFEVGFESLGSFSWLFAQRYGLSPSRYRAHHAVV